MFAFRGLIAYSWLLVTCNGVIVDFTDGEMSTCVGDRPVIQESATTWQFFQSGLVILFGIILVWVARELRAVREQTLLNVANLQRHESNQVTHGDRLRKHEEALVKYAGLFRDLSKRLDELTDACAGMDHALQQHERLLRTTRTSAEPASSTTHPRDPGDVVMLNDRPTVIRSFVTMMQGRDHRIMRGDGDGAFEIDRRLEDLADSLSIHSDDITAADTGEPYPAPSL